MAATQPHFTESFARAAARVRRRLALRTALNGAAIGLAIAIAPALVAWRAGHGAMRPYAALVGVIGAIAGLALARRRRWSDVDVALYLDARLQGDEAIVTAVEMDGTSAASPQRGQHQGTKRDETHASRELVVARAAEVLAAGDATKARPRAFARVQWIAPVAVATLVLIAIAPMPKVAPTAQPPGVARVTVAQAEGLEKIAKLAQTDARDEAQRERLEKLARDAAKLKEDLRAGMEKREAQDRIARLREAIEQERLSLGDGEKRAGLESAVSRLEQTPQTKSAAKALGDHDLESMDAEMEKLANAREQRDRAEAEKALDEAAQAAKKAGAPDVAKALEDEKRLLKERGERADAVRDLAEAMKQAGAGDPDMDRKLDTLNRESSDADARALAESMNEALEKLSPEERARVAKKLAQASKSGRVSSDPEKLKDLQKELETKEGQERLEQQLKDMAKESTESDEAQREGALDDAQEGADETEGQVEGKEGPGSKPGAGSKSGSKSGGGIPVPQPGDGNGNGNGNGNGKGGGSQGGDGTGGGGGHDFGTGSHKGQTPEIAGGTLKSRAHGKTNAAEAMPGGIATFAPGRAGGTANTRGTGDLRNVGPGEIEGIDKSDVPEEYREHVRQYFSP